MSWESLVWLKSQLIRLWCQILSSKNFFSTFTDRDKFVKVNTKDKAWEKLKESDVEMHGTPYDFLSIMHYFFSDEGAIL